ncbi:hypothetical protein LDFHOB_10705 [Candidatus Electronema aureum]
MSHHATTTHFFYNQTKVALTSCNSHLITRSGKSLHGPFTAETVLGRVIIAWRKGRLRNLEHSLWRLAGLVWLDTSPLGFFLLKGALFLRRFVRGGRLRIGHIWNQT